MGVFYETMNKDISTGLSGPAKSMKRLATRSIATEVINKDRSSVSPISNIFGMMLIRQPKMVPRKNLEEIQGKQRPIKEINLKGSH